ncbi:MAG TPA: FtsX-like permease family protein [Vicinamibacterales bacterium]|jgi:putative ABC transport system permease protein
MSFVLRMAIREIRASWRRLLLFFVCIALGVGGIVLLRSVVQDVRATIASDARGLIAADVLITTGRPWDAKSRESLEKALASAPVAGRVEGVETTTMVRPADERRPIAKMAEVRGVQGGFPLYGRIELQDGQRYSHRLLEGRGALVRPELLYQLESKVGEEILIGTDRFTIRGILVSEPGRRIAGFSFGPRVLVDAADLERSGLLGFGSRATREVLLKLPDGAVAPLVARLKADLKGQFVNVRSYRGTEDHVGEDLSRAENYLSLVGLVIVILGGIGVSSVTRVFVQQKVRSIAVLKCLGATSRQVFTAYLVQALLLGAAGCVLGVGLAAAGLAAIPWIFSNQALAGIAHDLTPSAVVQGVAIGLLVAVLFSVVPLLDVRRVKPSLLLRDAIRAKERDWVRWAALAVLLASLVLIASWQAASLRIGLAVSVGLAAVALVLHLAGIALVRALRPLAASRSVALRHAVLRLSRPGNQTRAVLLAVGLGTFFIVGVRSLQANLLDQFTLTIDATSADMFLIDVQPDQAAGVSALIAERTKRTPPPPMPVLRARVTAVTGREVNLKTYDEVRRNHGLGREFTVTWRDRLQPNERVMAGRFWGAGRTEVPEVSIEQGLSERSKIHVGDTMQFDVMGRVVSARVTSVRQVDWRDARQGGFMFVFRPGPLDRAPATYVATARGPVDPLTRARLQRDLVDRFPNVTVIDLREILQNVEKVLSKVTLGVSVVGGLVLVVGGLILIGSVSMTRFQRIYEVAIFRTLGAGTRLLTVMTAFEYGVLGLLAGAVGSTAAIVLTWYISRYALDIRWAPYPLITLAGIAITTVLVCGVGLAASADILRRRPLGTLRSE